MTKTMEWTVTDKSTWGEGPWMSEPDKRQWKDEKTGLPCLIVRGPSGSLCGYVGVPPEHSLHGKGYDDCDADVHGGLTFANGCADLSEENYKKNCAKFDQCASEAKQYPRGDAAEWIKKWPPVLASYEAWHDLAQKGSVCHIPAEGEPDHVWWFGFDCAHAGDKTPKYNRDYGFGRDEEYRNIEYVSTECARLAEQLKALDT